MDKISYKNRLQEYCQAKKIAFPIYESDSLHNHWNAMVTFNGNKYKSLGIHGTRKSAEQSAAEQVLLSMVVESGQSEQLAESDSKSKQPAEIAEPVETKQPAEPVETKQPAEPVETAEADSKSKQPHIILVDLENIQPKITKSQYYQVHCFISTFSSVNTSKYEDFTIHVIDCGASDAADYLLTFTAAELSTTLPNTTTFVLVSRDKKIEILSHILQKRNFHTLHFKQAKAFEDYLSNINKQC
jgi:hypothetical protein